MRRRVPRREFQQLAISSDRLHRVLVDKISASSTLCSNRCRRTVSPAFGRLLLRSGFRGVSALPEFGRQSSSIGL